MAVTPSPSAKRIVELTIDGQPVRVPEGTTLLDACRAQKIATPTLCYLENLTPVNVCRVCVVEVEGSRTLVPACSRNAENGMVVQTDSERVRLSRRLVLELLASSVDLSIAPAVKDYMQRYDAHAERFGPTAASGERDHRHAGHHHEPDGTTAATVSQAMKIDNDLSSVTIPAAFSVTNVWKPAAPMHRIPLPLRWLVVVSMRVSLPSLPHRFLTQPASIVAIVLASALLAR